MTTYFVKWFNGMEFEPCSRGGEKDIIVAFPDKGPLPLCPGDLIVLHEGHANRSKGMVWNPEDSTFKCPHCLQSVNISEESYRKILKALTLELSHFVFKDKNTNVTVACLVVEFPEKPRPGYYIVKHEDEIETP